MRILEIKRMHKQGYQALLSWAGTRIEARLYHEVYGISFKPTCKLGYQTLLSHVCGEWDRG